MAIGLALAIGLVLAAGLVTTGSGLLTNPARASLAAGRARPGSRTGSRTGSSRAEQSGIVTGSSRAEPSGIVAGSRARLAASRVGDQARLAARPGTGAAARSRHAICTAATARYRRTAARMSRQIRTLLRNRFSVVALAAADRRTRISCRLHAGWHFPSASIVKVLILATLLHDLQVRHENLTAEQAALATEMITESDNDAATVLWDEDGIPALQHFLDLAGMTHTRLGLAHWGLTQVTAHDEMILLRLLSTSNRLLDRWSRDYELRLMADVIPAQRWGVPAGAPGGVTVHLKNGWLPDPVRWIINSIGVFTQHHRAYRIVILTSDNPDMNYGVDTVQDLAEVINRGYNPGR